jgi:hypothetical protein
MPSGEYAVSVDAQGRGARAGRRLTRRAILFALLALSLLGPATASASRSEFYGIVQTATLDNKDLKGLQSSRVRTVRLVLKWGWVEPGRNSFRWDPSDKFIGGLAAHGIRVLPSLWGNPSWVGGSGSTPPVGGPGSESAWRTFLQAMAARYGPGGKYWRNRFHNQFGANAKPLPITSWQIWNEPNLKKFFAPYPSAGKYARLLQISHDAIRSNAPGAQIVLAGMPGYGDVTAWDFLRNLYAVPNIKSKFDAVALHPYGSSIDKVRTEIQSTRNVMRTHGDAATPLWITELAWGSAPPDRFGINKGPQGQAKMLKRAFNLILDHRAAWNIQRLFWYHWRDPKNNQASCSFCASAGLLRYNRTKKPAYSAFTGFTADTTKPQVTITSGPTNGEYVKSPTPSFSFSSSEHGSTFVCSSAPGPFKDCTSPYTLPHLSDGAHVFYVRAIDAAGNESHVAGRYFTVDTKPPAPPKLTTTSPRSPANDNSPKVLGTAAKGTTVKLFKTKGCAGSPVAQGTASQLSSPGITVTVPDNSTTSFRARAIDRAGNPSRCSAALTYVEHSTP